MSHGDQELAENEGLEVASKEQRTVVEGLASRKICGFRGTIGENGEYLDEVYRSNASLTASVATDYRDRFLIELIQNAYDAHLKDARGGHIEITLDLRRGTEGSLFVANTGRAFAKSNVEDLCSIGLSRKPLGESIGNKGLGFRSVVQITDTPMIYSQEAGSPGKDHFSGFCFRFAGADDYAAMIDDPRHLELARRDLPVFHIPVWLDEQDETVRACAANGFSTLVHLPLRDQAAREAVRREIKELRFQQAPMLLFLDRVESLEFRIVSLDGEIEESFSFGRFEKKKAFEHLELSRVDLADAGSFFMARRVVSEIEMRKAIDEAIARKELSEHWSKWSGDGEVALAVRLDAPVKAPRLYTYLPMGDQAAAPLFGYLHGSFFPSSNRKYLNARNQLNAMLLREATILAAHAIRHVIDDPSGQISTLLGRDECATVVADLMSWEEVGSLETEDDLAESVALEIATEFGCDYFEDAPVVPCARTTSDATELTWKSPKSARRWSEETGPFSCVAAARFAEKLRVWPIWSGLGTRLDRLDNYLFSHADGYNGEPSGEERALLVEHVAATLRVGRKSDRKGWLHYFLNIPNFMKKDATLLRGRPILLGDDGELHKAMSPATEVDREARPKRRRRRSETAIFSPPDPRRSDTINDLEVQPPKRLAQRFGFLATALPWHGELANVRTYLEESGLVEAFDREAVLTHLSRTLRYERNKEVLRGGLRWAFQLWRQPRASNRPIRLQSQHRFRVPRLDGEYIDAREALFSASWPTQTLGELLQDFLDASPSDIPDLDALAARRLAPIDHPAFRGKDIDQWVEFLAELGVGRGILPEIKVSKKKSFQQYQVSDFSFLNHYGIPREFGALWQEDIEALDPSLLSLPSATEYVISGELYWLPGQADLDSFSETCRSLYACLILEWLGSHPNLSWELEIHHKTFWKADARNWPTPLQAFLRTAHWFPVKNSEKSGSASIGVRPSDVWVNNGDGERFLPYLRRPVREVQRLLERSGSALIQPLNKCAGLRILDDPETLVDQLVHLADRFGNEGFDEHFRPRLLNLYYRTWWKFLTSVDSAGQEIEDIEVPVTILAQRHHAIEAIDMFDEQQGSGEIVYICDTERETDAELLSASGRVFFQLKEGEPSRTGFLLEQFYGERVRRISLVEYTLLADGNNIEDARKTPVLAICLQLRSMVAVSTEALVGTEAQRLPSDRSEILARLDRINLAKANRLSFSIDSVSISEAQIGAQAFHLSLENGQSAILVASCEEWSWDLVDRCIPAICEALGQRALAPHLRLLLAHVRRDESLGEADANSIDDLEKMGGILRLSPSSVDAARVTLNVGLERQAPWIRAILHYFGGPATAEAFEHDQGEIFQDRDLVQDELAKLLRGTPLSAKTLLDVASSALGPEDIRESLELDFARFNASLASLGLEPETYPDRHRGQLENFVRQKELAITDCLRWSCIDRLDKMHPAEGYAEARDSLRALVPDPAWLLRFKEPPTSVLEALVNEWLVEQGAPALGAKAMDLEPLDQVREHNRKFFPSFIKRALPLVRAWRVINRPSQEVDPSGQSELTETIRKRLDDIGVMDHRALGDVTAAKWLKVLEVWPADMPPSLDLEELGLSERDVQDERIKAREEQESRRREARLVAFNGRKLDPRDVDILALSDELRESLAPNVLRQALGSSADLAQVLRGERSSQGTRGRKDMKIKKRPRVPEEKTELIGRLGELIVYHWLRGILPGQDIDAAWVSENGTLVTGREGNDGLGYDFEVSYRQQVWQIEVKASGDDPQAFEVGETEVRAGRQAARSRSGVQYKIAYVSFVTDPSRTQIEMLPNPMSEEGSRVLGLLGEGIRYGFTRSLLRA